MYHGALAVLSHEGGDGGGVHGGPADGEGLTGKVFDSNEVAFVPGAADADDAHGEEGDGAVGAQRWSAQSSA